MKTTLNRTVIIVLFFAALLGCQKDEPMAKSDDPIAETPSPTTTQSTITGTIVIPTESVIDVNNLTIVSPIDKATVSDGTYEIATQEDQFLTQLVSDGNGDVLLMGFSYPGQTDFTIDTKSTALAILMNLPFSLLMTKEVKLELIARFLSNPDFSNLETAIEKNLNENLNLLDVSSEELATAISVFYNQTLFPQASKTRKLNYSYDPVDIRLTNNEITFVNLGKTYDTEIGIYKDDVKVKRITSERITFLPTTIGGAIGAFASAYGGTALPGNLQPVEYKYTFDEDGQYDIRIRTGKLADISTENQVALLSNYINWGTDLILEVLPLGDCVQPIIADFKQHAQTFGSFGDATTQQEKLGLLYDVLYTFFNQTQTLVNCLGSGGQLTDYLKKFASLLKFLDLVGKIGNGGNILVGIAQLVADNGKMDVCYQVQGDEVTECDGCDQQNSFTDQRDGKKYCAVTIGNQTWLAENLNYEIEGSLCPEEEQVIGCKGSNENCGTYGRLYNLEQLDIAIPDGWHLPSREEYVALVDFLGGPNEAASKLKADSNLWNFDGASGTNSSGFSALPVGYVIPYANTYPFECAYWKFGDLATFWTSTRNDRLTSDLEDDVHEFFRILKFGQTGFSGVQYEAVEYGIPPNTGLLIPVEHAYFPVRLIKD
ncbi:FISUMP domain-containing protein [Maribacter sp. 2307UL18-2]|uniref:FISUMP domain-containing protein n=1 Tax=Maribacter sp. 2307UL18-2 TaxID=3386274 RepID=UPI0039BD1E09